MNPHSEIQKYIDQINSKISFTEAHPEIALEIHAHLEEAILDLKKHSPDKAQAVRHAIQNMGNAEEIGNKLNAIHKDVIHWPLMVAALAMFLVGLLAMSALGRFASHATWGAIGVLVAGALVFTKPHYLKRSSLIVYFAGVILTALCWNFATLYEGQPYVSLGLLKINVVNFLFVPVLVATAGLIERFKTTSGQLWLLLFSLIPVAGLVGLNSFYLATTMALATLGMMAASSAPAWVAMLFSTLSLFLIFGLGQSAQFVGESNLSGAIASEAHTDFIIAHLRSHSPALFLGVLALGSVLLIQSLYASKEIKASYSRTLAIGGLVALAFSFGFGVLANLGFVAMPVTGVNVPFVSYGGSLTVGFFALIGVLVSLYRRKSLVRI